MCKKVKLTLKYPTQCQINIIQKRVQYVKRFDQNLLYINVHVKELIIYPSAA